MTQTAFRDGTLAEAAAWQTVVLIPKGKGEFRGIGLVEVTWKIMTVILHRRLMTGIQLHDVLHGFREGRGTGTATLDAKLLQQLAAMREEVLYVIFLDLTKAYDALDRSRTLEILKGYGVGERVQRLLTVYWERTTMVASAGSYYGKGFKGERGVTQGDPLSPTIFNVVVDAVVRHWLQIATQEAERRGERGKEGQHQAALFYADDGMIASSDPRWLKWAFTVLVGLFDRVGLRTNRKKNVKHDVQTVQHAGEQVGGNLRAHNDGGRTDAQGEEDGKSDVWGLWKGDGGGVTRFPPYDSTRKGKGEEMGMDGRGHWRGGSANV